MLRHKLTPLPHNGTSETPTGRPLFDKLRSVILGHDIFISYARADAIDYAPRLANQLSKLGFRCYLDQLDAPPGAKTPGAVMKALSRSSSLVIVGTSMAAASTAVGDEVDYFAKLSRTILPIDVDGALTRAQWSPAIAGLAKNNETSAAIKNGRPSRAVLGRIYDSAQFRRRNQQLRRAAYGVLAVIGLLIVIGAGLSAYFNSTARRAMASAAEAETKRQHAVTAATDAENLKAQATRDLQDAQNRLKNVETQLTTAEQQRQAAETAKESAQLAAKNADAKRVESEGLARKQEAIAESLDLANRSSRKLDARQLIGGARDAISSVRRLQTVDEKIAESDRALRKALAVFPQSLAPRRVVKRDGGFAAVNFSPDGEHFIVLNTDHSVEIYDRAGSNRQLVSPRGPSSVTIESSLKVALSNDLRRWAIAKPNVVEVVDIKSGQKWNVTVTVDTLGDIALSADGQFLVVISNDDTQVWNVEQSKVVASLAGKTRARLSLHSAAFSPDGKTLAIGGEQRSGKVDQGIIITWNGFPGDENKPWQQSDYDAHREELTLNDDSVDCLAIANGGKTYATCAGVVWAQTTQAGADVVQQVLYLPGEPFKRAVAFDPKAESVYVISFMLKKENAIGVFLSGWSSRDIAAWTYDVWSSSGYSAIVSVPYHDLIGDIKFDQSGNSISVVAVRPRDANDSVVRSYSTTTWTEQEEKQFGRIPDGANLNHSENFVIATEPTADRSTINILDVSKHKTISVTVETKCYGNDREAMISPDGNTLVALCRRASKKQSAGKEEPDLDEEQEGPESIFKFRRQADKFVYVKEIPVKEDYVFGSLSFHGDLLLLNQDDDESHSAYVLDLNTGREVHKQWFSPGIVMRTIFTSNSEFVAIEYLKDNKETGLSARIEVRRTSNNKTIAVIHAPLFLDFKFSLDGRYLAAASVEALVVVDLLEKREPLKLDGSGGHICFDEHSKMVAATQEGAVRVIDLKTFRAIAEISTPHGVSALAFSYDGKYLAGGISLNGEEPGNLLQVWHLEPSALLREATNRLSYLGN